MSGSERLSMASRVITQGVERGDRQWSGRDRAEHGSEGARAGLEAGCRHHGANRGLALGRPHGSVAVRVLALDHRRPQVALAGVVGGFDPAGEGRKRQHLVARPPHPGLDVARQIARHRRGQDLIQRRLQLAPLGIDRGGRRAADPARQREGRAEPQLKAERDRVVAGFERIGDVARQMRQAGLLPVRMTLLGGVTVRQPHGRIAFANSLTGPTSSPGEEILAAIKLYIDEVNRTGGVSGHPIELVLFDDASSPEVAHANVQKIADSPCVAVLGHFLSTVSLAAGQGYKAARIPALTGASSADAVTIDNPYYFRAQTPVSTQGRSSAEYLRHVFKTPVVLLLHSRDNYGLSFLKGFSEGYENEKLIARGFDASRDLRGGSLRATVEAAASDREPGIVVIGTAVDNVPEVLKAVRRQGMKTPVMATGGAGTDEFLRNLASEPEEKERPGFFSENLYAATPVIFDSASAAAQAFAAEYERVTGNAPGWIGARAYDTARLMVEALRRAGIQNRPETKQADRERVRAELGKINRPGTAVTGITESLYFDANRDMPRPSRVGFFRHGRFITAPLQLVLVENPEAIDLNEDVRKGYIVSLGSRHYWLQRVVYTGIDINRVNRIDVKQGTFNIDFYLWMRYSGEDDAPTQIEFPA